mgnify:FL=1
MSVNNCQFLGRVGQIETRYLPNGDAVTNLSLACNEKYKAKSGEMVEHCEWVRASFFGKQAETLSKWVQKGDQLYIAGSMRTREYTDKEGNKRTSTEIRGDKFDFVGGKRNESEQEAPAKPSSSFDDMDNQIPF